MSSRSYDQPDETVTAANYIRPEVGICPYFESEGTATIAVSRGHYYGAETPHFHKQLREGKVLPLNPYSRFDYRQKRNLWTSVRQHKSDGCQPGSILTHIHPMHQSPVLMSVSGTSVSGVPYLGNPDWNALLISALAGIQPDLDALTTAVEARQTIDMIVNARRDAQDLIREALRGGKHTVKAAADAWMSWRYGWQILGLDIKAIAGLINEPLRPIILSNRAGDTYSDSSSESWIQDISYGWVNSDPANMVHLEHEQDIDVDVSYRATVIARTRYQTLNAFADVFTTAWESVPYSFVADWFVNVGDVLAAWDVKRSCEILGTSIGAKGSVKVTTTSSAAGVSGPDMVSHSGGGSSSETYDFRWRSPGWVPSLVPSITVRLTSQRILDAAAMCSKRIL